MKLLFRVIRTIHVLKVIIALRNQLKLPYNALLVLTTAKDLENH